METHVFWLMILFEILLLAAAYGLYVRTRRREDRNRDNGAAPPATDLYASCLQEEILQTDTALSRLAATGNDSDPERKRLIETRLAFLHAEHKAVNTAIPGDDRFWAQLAEDLSPFLHTGSPGNEAGSHQSLLVESLHAQLRTCEKRLSNLEQFKKHFFELKDQLANSHALGKQLQIEVTKAIPDDKQSPELKELLDGLKNENERLTRQIEYVGEAFSDILRRAEKYVNANTGGITASISGIDEGVERIRDVITAQEQRIAELARLISEKELALEQKEILEQSLNDVRTSNEELQTIIAVFKDENDFLQVQISMLLKQELGREEAMDRALAEARQTQAEQETAYAELAERFATMEKEYLLVYEENRKLKDD